MAQTLTLTLNSRWGDDVTVIKRMYWTIPQPDAPKYRKDIMEGTEGVTQGWADIEQRQVLLTVIMDLPSSAKQSIAKETYTKNMKVDQGIPREQWWPC